MYCIIIAYSAYVRVVTYYPSIPNLSKYCTLPVTEETETF